MYYKQDGIHIFITPSPYSKGLSLASRKLISDLIRFSSEIKFNPIILGRRNKFSEVCNYYFEMIKWWCKANVILTIYPYICINLRRNYFLRKFETMLINWLNKNIRSILYIVDLPIKQVTIKEKHDSKTYMRLCEIEERIFKSFNILLVFNETMKREIQEKYDFDDDKFILFEMLDYWTNNICIGEKRLQRPIKVAFLTSNLNKNNFSWIGKLPFSNDISYSFFGNGGEWITKLNREDINYKSIIPPQKIPEFLSNQYHFGMINYDVSTENYLKYGSTSKFSAYMAAGLPVLCSSKLTYPSYIIEKYGVGLLFDSLDEIPELISGLNEEEYNRMRYKCIELGEKVRQGYFFKKAVNSALQKLSISGFR